MVMARKAKVSVVSIIEVAKEIVRESGEQALSLGAVAARLGVKVPSLYNHVNGLVGLRRALAMDGIAEMRKAMAGKELFAMAKAYVQFARENPGLYACMFIPQEWQDEAFHQEAGKTVDVVVQALKPYTLGSTDAIHVVRGLRSLLHGFSSLEAMGGFGMPVLPDESLTRMIEIYLDGI
jgi:AcrR family transcriptional regulator